MCIYYIHTSVVDTPVMFVVVVVVVVMFVVVVVVVVFGWWMAMVLTFCVDTIHYSSFVKMITD